ncbi:MAG TPA: hypothetical protein VGS97_10495 [Actinocrinis sp.]|uniref:hypothetical protein n=1 Tax=Actinocrinis sp. TaxID=1920516 RepID=UPI002DDD75D5|nr:hypothetical protein [Actinocrinis sp.]HEV2344510.1 hypothetical protein [Actinocrinis sp.]
MSEPLTTFSFGGGVQSVACFVLAATGLIPYRIFLFVNVADDSEHPATLDYLSLQSRQPPSAG